MGVALREVCLCTGLSPLDFAMAMARVPRMVASVASAGVACLSSIPHASPSGFHDRANTSRRARTQNLFTHPNNLGHREQATPRRCHALSCYTNNDNQDQIGYGKDEEDTHQNKSEERKALKCVRKGGSEFRLPGQINPKQQRVASCPAEAGLLFFRQHPRTAPTHLMRDLGL